MANYDYLEDEQQVQVDESPLAPEPEAAPEKDFSYLDDADPVRDQVRVNFAGTRGAKPDQAAQDQATAKRLGIAPDRLDLFPDQVAALDEPDFDRMPKATADFYLNPYNVAAARDDHKQLINIENLWGDMKASFERGSEGVVDLGDLYYRKHILGEASDKLEADIKTLEDKHNKPLAERDDFIGYLLTAAAEQIPIQAEMLKGGATLGAEGAMEGAMVAGILGQMGPQVATPEEVVTMPLGMMVGGKTGFSLGIAQEAFQMEAGHAAAEFNQFTDENGEKLDPQVARAAGIAVGAINAGLEFVGAKAVLKTIPGGEHLVGKFSRSGVKEALKSRSVREALKGVMGRYAGAVGTEALTEIAQEAVNIIGGEIAKRADEKLHDTYFTAPETQEMAARMLEAGKKAAAATLVLGAPGTTISGVSGVRSAKRAQAYHEGQLQINEAVNASLTKTRDADKMEEFLDGVGLGENVYVPGDAAKELFQSDPDAFERLGVTEEQINEAESTGQHLVVKTSKLHAQLEPEQFQKVAEVAKAAPSAMSAKELQDIDMESEVTRAAEQYEHATRDEQTFQEELARFRGEVIAAGGTQEYADNTSSLLEGFARRMALEGHELSDTVRKVKVQLGKEGQAETQANGRVVEYGQGLPAEKQETAPRGKPAQLPVSLRMFSNPMFAKMPGRNVKRGTVEQTLNQKGVKAIEKDVIQAVLNQPKYQGRKSFDYDEFKLDVERSLLRLEQISTAHYHTYGASNVGVHPQEAATIVYNSNIKHGLTGHFGSLFTNENYADKATYEVVQIPGRDLWVALDADRPAGIDANEMQAYVGTAGTKEEVAQWVADYEKSEPIGASGLFGHTRRWLDKDKGLWRIAELQSDFFQKSDAQQEVLETIISDPANEEQKRLAERQEELTDEMNELEARWSTPAYRAGRAQMNLRLERAQREYDEATDPEIPEGSELRHAIYRARGDEDYYITRKVAGNDVPFTIWEGVELYSHRGFEPDGRRDLEVREKSTGYLIGRIDSSNVMVHGWVEAMKGFTDNNTPEQVREAVEGAKKDLEARERRDYADLAKEGLELAKGEYEMFERDYSKHIWADGKVASLRKEIRKIEKELVASFTPEQKQFIAHRKNYTERMLREEIRQAGIKGYSKLRIPAPYTVAHIEGFEIGGDEDSTRYYVEEGSDPDEATPGALIVINDTERFRVFEVDGGEMLVAREDEVGWAAIDDVIDDYLGREAEDILDELPETLTEDYKEELKYDWYSGLSKDEIVYIIEDNFDLEDGETLDRMDLEDHIREALETNLQENMGREEFVREQFDHVKHLVFPEHEDEYVYYATTSYLDSYPLEVNEAPEVGPDTPYDELLEAVDDEDHQTVLRKYVELKDTLNKIRPVESVDENGFEWFEVEITPEDGQAPVILFQEDPSKRNMRRGSVRIYDGRYLISLFEKANLSTLPHELGHIFLEEVRDVVNSGQASRALLRDWGSIQKYLGVYLGQELTEEQHEQFARSFEAYLREGKAPSVELEGAFSRFRTWLKNIYESAEALDVKLSDEIRNTFDRLLATEDQIAHAAASFEMVARTEADLKKLGVNKDDRDYVNRLIDQGKEKAVNTMQKAKNRMLWLKRKQWRKDAEEQLLQEPVYRLRDDLYKNGGLSLEELRVEFGEEIAKKVRAKNARFAKKEGRPLDMMAAEHGFDSTEAMVNAIIESSGKKDRINQIVQEKEAGHDSEHKAEDYLVTTEETAEALETVGRYIGRALGTAKPIARKALRLAAKRQLLRMQVKDATRPDRFLAAMASATRKERDASTKGDFETALKENTKARYNLELAKQAQKLKDRIHKAKKHIELEAKAKRKKGKRELIEHHYRENIKALASRFGFVDVPFDADKKALSSLLGNSDDPLLDVSAGFDPWLVEGTESQNYRELTVDQFEQVLNLVDHLFGKGRDLVKDLVRHANMTKDAVVETTTGAAQGLRAKRIWAEDSRIGRAIAEARDYFAGSDIFLFVMRRMDGYSNTGAKGEKGPNEQLIYDPLVKAHAHDTALKEKVKDLIFEPIEVLKKAMREHPKKLLDTGVEVPEILAKAGRSWTYERVVAVALNMGNPQNLERIKSGYNLSDEDIEHLVAILGDKEWDAIQEIWDAIDTLWPDLDEAFYRLNYYHQGKVEGEAFTTPTGKRMKGGYYPIKYDSSISKVVGGWTEKDDIMNATSAMFPVPAARSNMMQSRAETGGGLPVRLSLSVLGQHIDYATRYISHAQIVRDIDRITQDARYEAMMTDKLGKEVYRQIRPCLKYIVRPEGETLNAIEKSLDRHRVLSTGYILGGNLSVALKQPYSLGGYAYDEGLSAYFVGAGRFLAHPVKAVRVIHMLSTYMRNRAKHVDRDIKDSGRALNPNEKEFMGITATDIRNSMFIFIKTMDFVAVYPAWWESYHRGLSKFEGDIQKAASYADEQIAASQPSSRPIDMSYYQRSNKGLHRLFTMFSTFTLKFGNRQRYHYGAWRNGGISSFEYMQHVILESIIPPMLMRGMFSLMWGEDWDWESATWDTFLYQIIGLPFVRDLINSTVSVASGGWSSDPGDSPVFTGAKLAVNFGKSMYRWLEELDDDDKWEKAVWAFADLVSYRVGIPASRVAAKVIKGMKQWEEGEGTPLNMAVPNPKK